MDVLHITAFELDLIFTICTRNHKYTKQIYLGLMNISLGLREQRTKWSLNVTYFWTSLNTFISI